MVDKIRQLCKERGKTIFSLEQECGLGNGSINKWDRSSPSVAKVIAVAKALGVPVISLIEGEVPEGPSPQFTRRTELLKRKNISLNELSEKTGISVYRLRRYFSEDTLGETNFFDEYPKLARALGVSPQYLHCLTDKENDESDTDERFRNYVVGHSGIQDFFPEFQHLYEQKKPTPEGGDGLSETAKQIMECVSQMSAQEQEAFLAWLQASQGRG